MVRNVSFSLVFLCFMALYSYGQKVDANKEIEQYFTSLLKNDSYNLSSEVIKDAGAANILQLANNNISNTNAGIRYKIIDLVKRKSRYVTEPCIRAAYAFFLTLAIKDPDSGNSGVASKSLTNFNTNDFNPQTKDTLYTLLTRKTYHFAQIIKLAGFLKIAPAKAFLKDRLINDSTLTTKDIWNYHLALARMDDETSIEYCLDKARSMPVNDNTVTYLFTDLVYTRQPLLIKFVLEQIASDAKNCNSPSPESGEKTICAFKIMEIVATAISDFPVKTDKYGDLEIDNYNDALSEVRNWISGNPELNLLNDIY